MEYTCSECQAAGLSPGKISVFEGETTCLGSFPYRDEQGRYHNHDPNRVAWTITCSNGHECPITGYHACWCGWSRLKEMTSNG